MVALKISKPTSPGRRFHSRVSREGLYKGRGLKALTVHIDKIDGRNNNGRITVRHRGGGHKRLLRVIDFCRDKFGVPAIVERLEYDPNRTAHIALLKYLDGEKRYIIAPVGLKVGDRLVSGREAPIAIGNALPMRNIPVGSTIHCVEMKPGKGAQLLRSAGSFGQLLSREGEQAIIRLKSGETRTVSVDCIATIGSVSNPQHNLESLGKAGAKRWLGIRPTVRGVAMNPVDHPHGGGEGKTAAGRHPVSPWGWKTKGKKTRRNKRTDSVIIHSRKRKA